MSDFEKEIMEKSLKNKAEAEKLFKENILS